MTDKERIAELETQLENARRLLQISDGRAARLSGEVDALEDGNHHLGEENYILTGRVAELEAALTDALYAWAMVNSVGRTAVGSWDAITNIRDFKKAGERIQRARLALPKESEGKHTCSQENKH